MSEISDDDQPSGFESQPGLTWTLVLLIGLCMLAAWLYFFFGLFVTPATVL